MTAVLSGPEHAHMHALAVLLGRQPKLPGWVAAHGSYNTTGKGVGASLLNLCVLPLLLLPLLLRTAGLYRGAGS
jgi:hypothetical protein